MKNRELIAINLAEAREQLEAIEESLSNPDYSEVELNIELAHAYHHLNFAWNIRHADESELDVLSDESYAKWSKYPAGEILDYD